jgi:DNA-binding GntR family transcriptional regulator
MQLGKLSNIIHTKDHPAAMSTIQQLSLTQQVYNILKQQIIERRLAPNTKLDINALAQDLDISRTPVVDALNRLDAEGLVHRRNRVGTFVAPMNREMYEEIFEARQMVEQWVCARVVSAIQPDDVERLRQILLDSAALLVGVTDDDFDYLKFMEYDAQFHLELVKLSGNSHIVQFYTSLNSHLHIARSYSLQALARSREGQYEHEMILNAYERKDLRAVHQMQAYHLKQSHDNILRLLEEYILL